MPDLDGIQATHHIRNLGASVHQPYIIALTAHDVPGSREHCFQVGMDDTLRKPMQLAELRQSLLGAVAAR
ncbi:MAG: response regulator [Oscillochloris sp.]|nr:response regulator [Oscillochloris sp.]